MTKVLQRDIEEMESYYHSGDFVGYDCCLETLEATVKQCCIHGSISGKQLDTIFRRYEKVLLPTFQELVNMRSRGIDMMSL